MKDAVFALIIITAVLSALLYIHRQKKNGAKCIGCPCSKGSSCHCCENSKK